MPFREGKREGNVACPPGTGTCLMLVVPRWSDRGASLSGRGQWACASRRTCKLEWRSAEPTEKRKLIAKPPRSHCSSTLCPLTPMLTPRPNYVVYFLDP